MSTGADCRFWELHPGEWYYSLQDYPYGATEDYTHYGPFPTEEAALAHLHGNHANPGGHLVVDLAFWTPRVRARYAEYAAAARR